MQSRDIKKVLGYLVIFLVGYLLGQMQPLSSFGYLPEGKEVVQLPASLREAPHSGEGVYVVNYILDGDTIHVKDEHGVEIKVRFLAVNTLELTSTDAREKCLAEQEKQFASDNLLGKEVVLAGDPTQPKLDKYGRTLAYAKILPSPPLRGENSISSTETFNELLMKTGNAKIYKSTPPATMYQKYLELQTEAIKNKLGIWNENNCKI